MAARALFAFSERETTDKGAPSIRARAGALLLAEGLDNIRLIAEFVKQYAEAMRRAGKRNR